MRSMKVGTFRPAGPDAPLRQFMGHLTVQTKGRRLHNVTRDLDLWLADAGVCDGLVTVFMQHTSASLTIQENTDPDVQADLVGALDRLAPERAGYRHSMEGADDMPAHIKTSLTDVSLQIPVRSGRMDLGTWQAVYVLEHRAMAHRRTLSLHFCGTF